MTSPPRKPTPRLKRPSRISFAEKKANASVTVITDEALTKAFPDTSFFAVLFRLYPVAVVPPEPFKSQNVFIVPKDGKMIHLTDTKGLTTYFKDHLQPVKDDNTAKQTTQAWLMVSQWFKQDGFYKFAVAKDDLKVAIEKVERRAIGKYTVTQGGRGELTATLTFDDKGKLVSVTEDDTIKPGPRPICQATKLLDSDPIVRRMAEQDILFMGRLCKEYLDEQRAKASPDLQKAIDRIWQRIVDEGW